MAFIPLILGLSLYIGRENNYLQMKSVRVGRSNRRIRVEDEHCEDWMAVEMGE